MHCQRGERACWSIYVSWIYLACNQQLRWRIIGQNYLLVFFMWSGIQETVTNFFLSNSHLSCFSFTWVFPLAQLIVSACTVVISWWGLIFYTHLIQDCVATDALSRLFLSMSSSSGEMNLTCFFLSFFSGSIKGTTWSLQAQSFVAGWSERHAAARKLRLV